MAMVEGILLVISKEAFLIHFQYPLLLTLSLFFVIRLIHEVYFLFSIIREKIIYDETS